MKAEFNPDGSIKLPGFVQQKINDNESKMRCQRCIKVARKVVSFDSPKKCVLRITLSDRINDIRFVSNIYNLFKEKAAVPTKLSQINGKEFEVEIGTDFKRCTDCTSLIGKYREYIDGNLIEEKGSCTFEGFRKSFAYEDYFD